MYKQSWYKEDALEVRQAVLHQRAFLVKAYVLLEIIWRKYTQKTDEFNGRIFKQGVVFIHKVNMQCEMQPEILIHFL